MKKEEIVKAIIKNLRDVNGKKFRKDDVQAIVNFFIDITKQSLRNRDRVTIRSFGTFVVRHKNSKPINCVRTGERTMTREKDHVAFIPSNDFDLDSIV